MTLFKVLEPTGPKKTRRDTQNLPDCYPTLNIAVTFEPIMQFYNPFFYLGCTDTGLHPVNGMMIRTKYYYTAPVLLEKIGKES